MLKMSGCLRFSLLSRKKVKTTIPLWDFEVAKDKIV